MRIDKYLSNLGYGSRKEITKAIKDGYISLNHTPIFQSDLHIHFWDMISFWEHTIEYKETLFVMLHKPTWYISSKKPEWWHPSYLDLLENCPYAEIIDIVGRLDFDTSGLLLLTNDGALTHQIISPKKEIFKKYLVTWKNEITDHDLTKLESGVKIDDTISKPAKVERISDKSIFLSISEGKFHQVKKMFQAIGNEVENLHRSAIWWLELDNLPLGEWRYIEEEEIQKIFS